MSTNTPANFIISGGGTGGHIFPAISIANAIKKSMPDANILFVGAEGRMEMEKVPNAGYKIVGLPIQGLYRSFTRKNIKVLRNAIKSVGLSKKIIQDFKPDAVIGVGGYASGPVLWQAGSMNIPTLIQEQNSYAGITNKLLGKRCKKICVAYDNMERFFPKNKIIITGNPVRQQLLEGVDKQQEAFQYFNLDPQKKTILVIGGSLGAGTINKSVLRNMNNLTTTYKNDVQVIWQTGKYYIKQIRNEIEGYNTHNMVITDFVTRMDLAYSIADLVISRAGASSISELSLLRKACILVPSPNVAEDHQTKNAMALVAKEAAKMIPDNEAQMRLIPEAIKLINDNDELLKLSQNIEYFAKPDAAQHIANTIFEMIGREINTAEDDESEEKELEKKVENDSRQFQKTQAKNYFFLGIGGIGMSAIARYFNKQGHNVGGYDLTSTDLTKSLEEEGIDIHYSDNISLIPVKFMDPENTTVVYTPAIPNNMSEFVFFKEGKFNILKRSQVLGIITEGKHSICVAGSHGKTTTSTMIAHILYQSKIGTNAFLGGISKNYDTNLLVTPNNNLVVVEADEYDRSFLSLTPYMAVVTATDADHLDIYGSKEEMLKGFAEFTSLIQPEGVLIIKNGIELVPAVQDGVKVYTYSATDESADFHAENVRIANSTILFDFKGINGIITDIELGVPVMVNIENAVAAIAIALLNGASTDEIKNGVKSFDGTKRRFDLKVKKENVTYIDDYAHHPNEIKASIASVRKLYPDKKICVVFQPHLYTRTRDFAAEFGESLSNLDDVILLDIYPARELPIKKVTSELIYKQISGRHKTMCKKSELLEVLKTKEFDVLLTLGAGDIDKLVPEIQKFIEQKA